MRLKFTLLFLLLIAYHAHAQKLTGIWRGYFSSPSGLYRDGVKEEMYKYEIQILENKDNSISGVSFSYKTTVFYGKASMIGIFSPKAKSITLKETGLLELKITDQSQPCLMTCYLDYSKMDKLEVLQGTFMSVNIKDKGDCGAGKVYLEKVLVSDFKQEDFLSKKKQMDSSKIKKSEAATISKSTPTTKSNPLASDKSISQKQIPNSNNTADKSTSTQTIPTQKATITTNNNKLTQPKTKPGAELNLVKPSTTSVAGPTDNKQSATNPLLKSPKDTIVFKPKEEVVNKIRLPKVLTERENNLVKTIQTPEEFIQIDLYDNGTIDHDSISVYHNNKQVIKNGGLSYTPISIKIKCSKDYAHHELIMVAENLGEIPPNTALMVITAGKQRFEVFLTSTEQKNAKVVIDYKPKE